MPARRSTTPTDHREGLQRALLSLDGLSVGDAFGSCSATGALKGRELPLSSWRYTDDTKMALGIVEVIQRHGRIDQEVLAAKRIRARDSTARAFMSALTEKQGSV